MVLKKFTLFLLVATLLCFGSACDRISPNDAVHGSDSKDSELLQPELSPSLADSWENYVFHQWEASKPYQLYYFRQLETADEYVLRDISFNPDYKGEIVIDIPAQDMEGGTLKEIEALSCFGEIPALILASDFEAHILEPLRIAVEENKISSFQYSSFIASYQKESLADKKTVGGRENLLLLYPICQYNIR